MKTKISSFCATLLIATAVCLHADAAAKTSAEPKKGSPEFERMKTLVGAWQGKVDIGQGPVDMTVQYRLLAGGSVLEERCFSGTPRKASRM